MEHEKSPDPKGGEVVEREREEQLSPVIGEEQVNEISDDTTSSNNPHGNGEVKPQFAAINSDGICVSCLDAHADQTSLKCFFCKLLFHATCTTATGKGKKSGTDVICTKSFYDAYEIAINSETARKRCGNFLFVCDGCMTDFEAGKTAVPDFRDAPVNRGDDKVKRNSIMSDEGSQESPSSTLTFDQMKTLLIDMKEDIMVKVNKVIDDKLDTQKSPLSYSEAASVGCFNQQPPIRVVPETLAPGSPVSREVIVLNPVGDNPPTAPLENITKRISKVLKNVEVSFTAANNNSKKISLGFPDVKTRDEGMAAINEGDFLSSLGYQSKNATKMLPKMTVHNVRNCVLDDMAVNSENNLEQTRDLEKKTLRELILAKNTSIQPLVALGHTFEIIYLNKNKFGEKNLTIGLKVSPAVRTAILDKQRGYIYIDCQSYAVSDRFYFKECYHCQMLGHISTDCPNKTKAPTCLYCMGQHMSKDCTRKRHYEQHCCARCFSSKDKNESVNYRSHNASSSYCPVMERERTRLAAMTELTSKNVM